MNTIAVIGPGAIGGAIASTLLACDIPVTLCGRTPMNNLHVLLRGAGQTSHRVQIHVDPREVETHDLIILATRAHHTAGATPWLRALAGDNSTIVVAQNGVEHEERVRPWLGSDAAVLPAVVDLPASRVAPGQVEVARAGSITLPRTQRAQEVVARMAEVASSMIRWSTSVNFTEVMWRKLCVNVISGAIPALTNKPGRVFRRPEIMDLGANLIRECVEVARAEGVDLGDISGDIVTGFAGGDPERVNAMLLARREGRPLEWDARNGAVGRIGRMHGIPTPYNDAVAALLSAINS